MNSVRYLNTAFFDLLKELIRQPSVVGAEHSFFRVLQRALEERGADVTWYEGLLVAQGSRPRSQIFSAHIDRHGLVCTGPGEFQFAAFVSGNRSDLLGNSVSEAMMSKVSSRFAGLSVFAYEPWSGVYRGTGKIISSQVCPYRNNLTFELEDMDYLVAGTPVAFYDRLRIENGRISGQLDNVLTAAMLVHLFDCGFEGTALFSAQEEAGKSWRYLLEWFRRFDATTNRLIVVDTSPYETVAEADRQQIVLRHADANAGFNAEFTAELVALCEQKGISYAYKDDYIREKNREPNKNFSLGSTELGRIIAASNGQVSGSTLQIPTTDYHTMNESASLHSCDAFMNILLEFSDS